MEKYLSISEAAKEVSVEGHVLRYWEEELKLSIGRNEQGHRSYSPEDVEQLKQIKNMKEQGLGLKAIKMVMENGRLDVLQEKEGSQELAVDTDIKAEKAKQLQWMLRQLIREAVQESNREFAKELRESVVKELDYQFRVLEEQEETREEQRRKREEEHFQKLDELLRKKSKKKRHFI